MVVRDSFNYLLRRSGPQPANLPTLARWLPLEKALTVPLRLHLARLVVAGVEEGFPMRMHCKRGWITLREAEI